MSDVARIDFRAELDTCRRALGTRSSSFWHSNERELCLHAPHWLTPDDELSRVFDEQERIFVQGRVVLGVVLQSNGVLRQHGDVGGVVAVVHSADPWFEEHPEDLVEVADRMLEFVDEDPLDDDESRIARFVREEHARALRERVPAELGGGREVFYATTYAQRSHLPAGWLAGTFVPLLVAPEPRPACAILPAHLWPAPWRERWSAPAPRVCDHPSEVSIPGRGLVVVGTFLVADLVCNRIADALHGARDSIRSDHVAAHLDLVVSGIFLLALTPWLARTRRSTMRRIDCDHRVVVVRDDRFFKLPVWACGVVLIVLAVAWTIGSELG